MTPEQIGKAFRYFAQVEPRAADLAVLEILGSTPETVAEYLWDHMLGEPDEPTLEEVIGVCEEIAARGAFPDGA